MVPIATRVGTLQAHFLACEPELFDPAHFERDGLACPPTVARSVHKRQAEFYFGRMAARAALAEHGAGEATVAIGNAREPVWPTGFIGSITHCHRFAAAVVAKGDILHGIGIDAESVAGPQDLLALWTQVMDAQERALLERLEAILPRALLTTVLFSAKESLFKATHACVRRHLDFSAARLVAVCHGTGRLTLELTEDLHALLPAGEPCELEFRLLRTDLVFTSFVW